MAFRVEVAKAFVRLEADMKALDAKLNTMERDGERRMASIGQAWGMKLGKFAIAGLAAAGVTTGITALLEKSAQIALSRARLAFQLGDGINVEKAMTQFVRTTAQTGVALQEQEQAFLNASRGGLEYKESLKLVSEAAYLARLTGENLTAIVGGAANVFQFYGGELGTITNLVNKLTVASKFTQEGVVSLLNSLTLLGPVAQDLGLGLDSLVGILTELQNSGIASGRAATGLLEVLTRLEQIKKEPTEAFSEALERMGHTAQAAFEQFKQGRISAFDLLVQLDKTGIETSELDKIFDSLGARIVNILVKALQDTESALNKVTAAMKNADEQTKNFKKTLEPRGWEKITRMIGQFWESLGIVITDVLDIIVDELFPILKALPAEPLGPPKDLAPLAAEPFGPPKHLAPAEPPIPARIDKARLQNLEKFARVERNLTKQLEELQVFSVARAAKMAEEQRELELRDLRKIAKIDEKLRLRAAEAVGRMQEAEEAKRLATIELIARLEEERIQRVREFEQQQIQKEFARRTTLVNTVTDTVMSFANLVAGPFAIKLLNSSEQVSAILDRLSQSQLESLDVTIKLIQRSKNFQAIMTGLDVILQDVADMFGFLLQPLADFMRWLTGETPQAADGAGRGISVNVPEGLKLARLEFEAMQPGLEKTNQTITGTGGILASLEEFAKKIIRATAALIIFDDILKKLPIVGDIWEEVKERLAKWSVDMLGKLTGSLENIWGDKNTPGTLLGALAGLGTVIAATITTLWVADNILKPINEAIRRALEDAGLLKPFEPEKAALGITERLRERLEAGKTTLPSDLAVLTQGVITGLLKQDIEPAMKASIEDFLDTLAKFQLDIALEVWAQKLREKLERIPSAQRGGFINKAGLVNLHEGEMVLPARAASQAGTTIYWNGNLVIEGEDAETLLEIIRRYNLKRHGVSYKGNLVAA